ncbi:GNAT family N-acetyltransferase [Neobacillus novalis]|uniref:GNAT family N-acetyltransferase n=1 Tax=Neobacillus novalis TaxID=220687 RepID=A0AA95MV97_9BACI|nr:GNAT family N-acetyltransferase [Neobacillus novalis]WHY88690.1 GNAT family N-acetyltransferase [Neobacillus novalis]
MSISLKGITQENWEECIQLEVAPHQKSYIASNVYSLAESKFETSFVPMGIYLDNRMIGFLMYGKDPEDGTYWIIRFMMDQTQQGKGYGKLALAHTMNFLAALPDCSQTIILGVKESNTAALRLYQSFGFKDTGRKEHGELLLEYIVR